MGEWKPLTSEDFRSSVWPDLAEDVRGRIEMFAADVLRFGRAQNLVSRRDPEGEVARLVEESVRAGALLRFLPIRRVLEIGSGAGFPGLVLAAGDPGVEFVLVERRRARCDFLERCALRLGLDRVQVRAEDVRGLDVGDFDLVTGKAVADAETFLAWARPRLRRPGWVLLFQRSSWAPPTGWVVETSAVGLEQVGIDARVIFLVRPL